MLPDSEKEYLLQFHSIFRNPPEAEQYLYDSWIRMQVVLDWMKFLQQKGVQKVLELGSNPYFLTLLLKRHFDFQLSLANFFSDSSLQSREKQTIDNGKERHEMEYSHFNVEKDAFPYEENSFDCVIFCEILEHLLLNPDFTLAEIRRILKPSGYVVVSTPNAARLSNLVTLARGKNIYADYSPHGIYGRHNREYTFSEVVELLTRHSFEIVKSEVRNIYPHPLKTRILQKLRPQTWYEHIFVLGEKGE
ncbi:class I SAM-dependent methyltransferase [bacterium]|nr:class I SAM-dependent methyltransferase [bacterium]